MSHTTDRTAQDAADASGRAVPPQSVRRLASVGLTTDHANHDAVGALAPSAPAARAHSIAGHDRITEAVVLTTCNRVEVYLSARTPADCETAAAVARDAIDAPDEARTRVGRDVLEHLCRVASGLDSEVLGEDHVLGQVARTFAAAAEGDLAGGVLGRAADAAVAVGRAVRAETAINEGHVGYGSAACEAIAETEPAPDRLVVVGAGEVAESVVRAAGHRWDARIDVVNRTPAPELTSDDGEHWALEDSIAALAGADAVVTATGAREAVVGPEHGAVLADGTPIVDLATPPDVADEVAATHPVTTLSGIQSRLEADAARRRGAVPEVEERVAVAVARFVDRERESRAEDTIRALHRETAAIRSSELARARQRVEDGEADVETVLEDFASALTSRLLADPTAALRAAARTGDERTVAATRRLFDLQEGDQE